MEVLLVALAVACALYVHRRVGRAFRLSALARGGVLFVLLAAGAVPTFLCLFGGFWSTDAWRLGSVGLFGTAFASMALMAIALVARLSRRFGGPPPQTAAPEPGRREVLIQLGTVVAVGAGFGSSAYGAFLGVGDYETEHVSIPIPGLPRQLDGYRIVQLSDIHFGAFVGERELRAAVALVEKARADVIVLTGDLIDWDSEYIPLLGRLVHRLGRLGARDGVAAISGNHDYHVGATRVLEAARRAGASVLRNESRTIAEGHLSLLGVDWGHDADLARAQSRAPRGLPQVLLCHDPRFFDQVSGRVALQLSGHTHGGQISPLGINPTGVLYRHVRGLYEENGTHLYVNRGFGVAGPPLRVGSAPEVTVVHLRSA